jgi:hypothetical protein
MSRTLRKADGDLFIDRETGRPEFITGPTKVDQELSDLYLTKYDDERDWGAEIQVESFQDVSIDQFRSVLFLRVQQANQRLLAKQGRDDYLAASEKITGFSSVEVYVDQENQTGLFISIVNVGDEALAKTIGLDFKPQSLRHVFPPPATTFYK